MAPGFASTKAISSVLQGVNIASIRPRVDHGPLLEPAVATPMPITSECGPRRPVCNEQGEGALPGRQSRGHAAAQPRRRILPNLQECPEFQIPRLAGAHPLPPRPPRRITPGPLE